MNGFWNKKIPTIIALLVVAIGVFGTTYLVQNLGPLFSRATASDTPGEVKITNITDSSLTISWITQNNTTGSVRIWEKEDQALTALDDRDASPYKTHYVSIGKLTPQTSYLFTINSGNSSYENNGTPYKTATLATTNINLKKTLAAGNVINEDGTPASQIIVYLFFKKTENFSAITSKTGDWKITGFAEFAGSDIGDILITDGEKQSSIKTLLGKILPITTLGQNYDFITNDTGNEASLSAKASGFKTGESSQTVTTPKILNPEENENFTDLKPRFSGVAPKGSNVKITIESDPIETTVQTDNNGNWSYRPSNALTPGDHTITITAPDSSGILRTIKRSFKVFAEGSQVGQTATPSATPVVKATPTPTLKATPTPGKVATISAIPTKSPGPIPVTGESFPLIFLGSIGAITFLIGFALLF